MKKSAGDNLTKLFNEIDKNKDGVLQFNEFSEAMLKFDPELDGG